MRSAAAIVLGLWACAAGAAEGRDGAETDSASTATATSTPTATTTPTDTVADSAVHPERSASAEAEARSRRAATSTGGPAALSAASRAETYVPGKGPAAVPPSLTASALADELRKASKERRAERTSLAEERVRLQKLEADIATARAALRDETAKLQKLLASGGARARRGGAAKPGRSGDAGVSPLAALARTVKGMRPEPAAALLSRLDRSLAGAILEQMRAADAAAVVEKMDPATGAALFALLARSTP